ncbi:hypothetical protein C8R44DRAFT_729145 [Mycena epipterygia]|nr:hypothetical protein C8R44DRAFT_729145 [Mycena epipterygia]
MPPYAGKVSRTGRVLPILGDPDGKMSWKRQPNSLMAAVESNPFSAFSTSAPQALNVTLTLEHIDPFQFDPNSVPPAFMRKTILVIQKTGDHTRTLVRMRDSAFVHRHVQVKDDSVEISDLYLNNILVVHIHPK